MPDESQNIYRRRPKVLLSFYWLLWKLLIVGIAFLAPGRGYDTSTTLTEGWASGEESSRFIAKFVRWDSIYFTHIAEYGYIFEQEWAFGWGFTRLVRILYLGRCDKYLIRSPHKLKLIQPSNLIGLKLLLLELELPSAEFC